MKLVVVNIYLLLKFIWSENIFRLIQSHKSISAIASWRNLTKIKKGYEKIIDLQSKKNIVSHSKYLHVSE